MTSIGRYADELAHAHGIEGHAVTPDGSVVYAAFRDGSYEFVRDGEQLTSSDGDLHCFGYVDGRGTVLGLVDEEGNEQYDLVEVDPDSGDLSVIFSDDHSMMHPRPSPVDPDRFAFVSTRAGSLDLYTLSAGDDEPTRVSTTDLSVAGFDWSPDGDRFVYQVGMGDDVALYVGDESSTETLVDEPDSEQKLVSWKQSASGGGRRAWSEHGIAFTTNHDSGYLDVAVADADGDYEFRLQNDHDKEYARWTPDGDIAFVENRVDADAIRVLSDDGVETVDATGANRPPVPQGDSLYYVHWGPETAGDLYRDGELVVPEGRVDVPTVSPEVVTYESFDGREVPALHYTPEGEATGAVVKAHGGPEAKHRNKLDLDTQSLVAQGFEVLAPDVRGSAGYGREYRKRSDGDLGGGDLDDYVAAASYLRDRGHSTVGLTGSSYGGYIALMGVSATDAFDASACYAGTVNWETYIDSVYGYFERYFHRKLGGTPEEKPGLYAERSPITHADDIDDPLLVAAGANDPRSPPSEAEQLVVSLEKRDVPYEYLLFEDEGHVLVRPENRAEYVTRLSSFFDEHLRGA